MALNRIIVHMTNAPVISGIDKNRFHYLIPREEATVYPGKFPPEANDSDRMSSKGAYAAHTKGLSQGAIGIGVVGVYAVSPMLPSMFPMNKVQLTHLVLLLAKLCKDYKIEPSSVTIVLSTEIESLLGVDQPSMHNKLFDTSLEVQNEIGTLSLPEYLIARTEYKMMPLWRRFLFKLLAMFK